MEYYRCPENHVLRRVPKILKRNHMRTKCGWCGEIVTVVPCPEAAPRRHARRNPFAPSIIRQRKKEAAQKRAKSVACSKHS